MRNAAIDVARGIGILLVVVGHTPGIPPLALKLIYSFHMPMFFILSGYLFNQNKSSVAEVVPRLTRRLIVPYFFVGLSCAIPSILTGHTTSAIEFITRVGYTFYSIPGANYTFLATPIWFLTCLFCVEVVYTFIWSRARESMGLWVFVSVLLGLCIFRYLDYYYPWNIQLALVAVGFYHVGTMLRKINFFETPRFPVWGVIMSLLICYFAVSNAPQKVDFSQAHVGDILLFCVTTLSGSLAVFGLSTWLSQSKLLKFFGVSTIFILGYNYWIVKMSTFILAGYGGWGASVCLQLFMFSLGIVLIRRSTFLSSVFGPRR